MANLEVKVALDLSDIMNNPKAKKELYDQLVCDSGFMDEFITLLIDGYTNQDSYPCSSTLANMRERILEGFKLTTEADLVRQLESKNIELRKTWGEKWGAENELKWVKDLFKHVVVVQRSGLTDSPTMIMLEQREGEPGYNDTRKIIKFIKEVQS
jgi:hypothetical protein